MICLDWTIGAVNQLLVVLIVLIGSVLLTMEGFISGEQCMTLWAGVLVLVVFFLATFFLTAITALLFCAFARTD